VLPHVNAGSCLIDLRCIDPADDDTILDAIRQALAALKAADAGGVS